MVTFAEEFLNEKLHFLCSADGLCFLIISKAILDEVLSPGRTIHARQVKNSQDKSEHCLWYASQTGILVHRTSVGITLLIGMKMSN